MFQLVAWFSDNKKIQLGRKFFSLRIYKSYNFDELQNKKIEDGKYMSKWNNGIFGYR